jgi:hypothetical protein
VGYFRQNLKLGIDFVVGLSKLKTSLSGLLSVFFCLDETFGSSCEFLVDIFKGLR